MYDLPFSSHSTHTQSPPLSLSTTHTAGHDHDDDEVFDDEDYYEGEETDYEDDFNEDQLADEDWYVHAHTYAHMYYSPSHTQVHTSYSYTSICTAGRLVAVKSSPWVSQTTDTTT